MEQAIIVSSLNVTKGKKRKSEPVPNRYHTHELTNNLHRVSGVDVAGGVKDTAGVAGTVLWLQVLQSEGPLWSFGPGGSRKLFLVLPPGDAWRRVSRGHAV